MLFATTIFLALLACRSFALPAHSSTPHLHAHSRYEVDSNWDQGAVNQYPIHPSCNLTETTQLRKALAELEALAEHAAAHVLRWGNSSEIYRKYFGDAPSAPVIGNFERVVNGDKARTLFRCDDPDGNCQIPTYGGHWRGENGTDETVICPRSYMTRRPLSQVCALGYNVAEWPTNTYFASDLLHRVYHMPAISEWYVDHFAEDYQEVIEMAQNNNSYSVHDSDTLQYFALEAYAHDIAVPGTGCPGPSSIASSGTSSVVSAVSSSASASSTSAVPMSSTTSSAMSSMTSAPATPVQQYASSTLSIPPGCHTHANGELHCE